jgi:hypothetical protein
MADLRCAVCEEPIDLLDWCYMCAKLKEDYRTSPGPVATCRDQTAYPGPCKRGHERYWSGDRWRCKGCEGIYVKRNTAARAAVRRGMPVDA